MFLSTDVSAPIMVDRPGRRVGIVRRMRPGAFKIPYSPRARRRGLRGLAEDVVATATAATPAGAAVATAAPEVVPAATEKLQNPIVQGALGAGWLVGGALSYHRNKSIGWAALHSLLGWGYVGYWVIDTMLNKAKV